MDSPVLEFEAFGHNPLDWVVPHADRLDVVPVECLVVAVLQRNTVGAEAEVAWLGDKELDQFRIVEPSLDLVSHKFRNEGADLGVEEHRDEGRQPDRKSTRLNSSH